MVLEDWAARPDLPRAVWAALPWEDLVEKLLVAMAVLAATVARLTAVLAAQAGMQELRTVQELL